MYKYEKKKKKRFSLKPNSCVNDNLRINPYTFLSSIINKARCKRFNGKVFLKKKKKKCGDLIFLFLSALCFIYKDVQIDVRPMSL